MALAKVLLSVALVACFTPVAWTRVRRQTDGKESEVDVKDDAKSDNELDNKNHPGTAKITSTINKLNDDGSYTYGFTASDGSYRRETRKINGEIFGQYGYIDNEGFLRSSVYGVNSFTRFGFEPVLAINGLPLIHPSFSIPAVPLSVNQQPEKSDEENRSLVQFSTEESPEDLAINGRKIIIANRKRQPVSRQFRLLDNGKKIMVVRRQKSLKNIGALRRNLVSLNSVEQRSIAGKRKSNANPRSQRKLNAGKARQLTFAQRYEAFIERQKVLKAQELFKQIPLERMSKNIKSSNKYSSDQSFTIEMPLKKPMMLTPSL